MAIQRIMAALRARLLSSPELVALIGDRVQAGELADVAEPVYPLITLNQMDGMLAVWAPRTTNPQRWMVQIHSQKGLHEAFGLGELVTALFHEQKNRTSGSGVCFHQIREIWSHPPVHDQTTNVWSMALQYETRASIV